MDELFKLAADAAPLSNAPGGSGAQSTSVVVLQHAATTTNLSDALIHPSGIVILPNNKLVVASEGTGRVVALSAECTRVKQPAKIPTFIRPTALVHDGSSLFVADAGSHNVTRLSLKDLSPTNAPAGGPGAAAGQLQLPSGLALIDGILYVSDCNNHRIVQFHHRLLEAVGEPIGGEGSEDGKLRYPHGLAVLLAEHAPSDGAELLVADSQNHRVQAFTPSGAFLRSLGCYGQQAGQFDEPVGVATAHSALIVVERARVQVLAAADGTPLQLLPMAAGSPLGGIAISRHRAYVTQREPPAVHIFTLAHSPIASCTSDARDVSDAPLRQHAPPPEVAAANSLASLAVQPPAETDAAVAPHSPAPHSPVPARAESVAITLESPDLLSCLFEAMQLGAFLPAASVCSLWAQEAKAKAAELAVLRYTRALTGELHEGQPSAERVLRSPEELPRAPQAADGLRYPTHVAELPSGHLVVSESATSQLSVLSASGHTLRTIGERGGGPSDLYDPRGLLVHGNALFIADSHNKRLQQRPVRRGPASSSASADEVTADGEVGLATANSIGVGDEPDGLQRPDGLARHGDAIFVTDKGAHCLCCYDLATLKRRWTVGSKGADGGQLCDPGGVAVHEEGTHIEVVVAEVANHRLSVFTIEGVYARAIGRHGHAPGCFHQPSGVASARGRIIVAERRRVQILTRAGIPQQVLSPPGCGSLYGVCLAGAGRSLIVADYEARVLHELAIVK